MRHYNNHIQPATWLKFCLFLFFSFGIWQFGVQPVQAEQHEICLSGCPFSTIQAAINVAENNDVLVFLVNKETYTERITINNKSLTFIGNTTSINAEDGGTAVTIIGNPTIIMQNMIIQNGSTEDNGGGILLTGGNLSLTNVTLNGNDATSPVSQGGALYVASGSSALLTDVTIDNNTAVSGGGIYNNGSLTASNLASLDNDAANGGGVYNSGTATLDNQSAARRNDATQSGGGFFNASGAMLTLINSDLSNNTAVNGAAIYNAGTLQLSATDIGAGNEAATAGGGLYNNAAGQTTLSNSAVFQNRSNTGAGIYNAGTLTATNSTLSRNSGLDNQPNANGPGLYNQSGTAVLNNVTIHLTVGTSLFVNGGSVTVGNTIISSVSGQMACGGDGLSQSNSNGYNLASDQSCTFLAAPGDKQGINPDLNAITSPTEGAAYHTPKLTSPVVDVGNPAVPASSSTACLASDQRGLSRPQSRQCDIGAVEIVVYRLYLPMITK